jgi:uncharacterized protein (DUF58 family)
MILFLLIGIFIVAGIWELYYRGNWSRNVTVRLWFETDKVYAGNETKLYEVIENRKRMPLPVLEVGFHTKKELDFADTENTNVSDFIYKRDVFSVLGNQKITREIPVKCTKRGRYEISDADIMSYNLLYARHYSQSLETTAQIYVYPRNTDVSDVMTLCERMLGDLQCSKHLYEDPFSFRTIRSYTTDDPMKTINWKASAKTGGLMVNTFDSVRSQRAMIFLDIEDGGILKYGELVEESISIAATIIRKLSRQGTEVGFIYNGDKDDMGFLLPTTKKGRLAGVEKSLAEYDAKNLPAPPKLVSLIDYVFNKTKEKLSDDTLLIFVTKNFDKEIFGAISENTKDFRSLVIVPAYNKPEIKGVNDSADRGIKSTQNIRIFVKEVERT